MRRDNTRPIGEVLSEYIDAFRLKGKLAEVALLNSWADVVGGNIASRTKDLKISNATLYVKIDSSILKQELMMIRGEVVKRLNEKAGLEVIRDLVFF
jgi:hypothetical protein